MRNGLQRYVHFVGFAGSGKTTLVDALERNFPGEILSATRNYERSGRLRRWRARLSAMRHIPRTFRIVAASRPKDLRDFPKLMRLFHDHYRKLECAALTPVPVVVFDEGIPHKLRAMRGPFNQYMSFADFPEDSQTVLADRLDCVVVLKPPVDVWRDRRVKRGLALRDRANDERRYEESMQKTLQDVRAICAFNPRVRWILTEGAGDVDAEAHRIARDLLASAS